MYSKGIWWILYPDIIIISKYPGSSNCVTRGTSSATFKAGSTSLRWMPPRQPLIARHHTNEAADRKVKPQPAQPLKQIACEAKPIALTEAADHEEKTAGPTPQPIAAAAEVWALRAVEGAASFALTDKSIWVGRWRERVGLWLDDRGQPSKASRMHARLDWDSGSSRWALIDNDSANGTFVNGEAIKHVFLRPGDQVGFGSSKPAPVPGKDAAGEQLMPRFHFEVVAGPKAAGSKAPAVEAATVVGPTTSGDTSARPQALSRQPTGVPLAPKASEAKATAAHELAAVAVAEVRPAKGLTIKPKPPSVELLRAAASKAKPPPVTLQSVDARRRSGEISAEIAPDERGAFKAGEEQMLVSLVGYLRQVGGKYGE